MLAFALVAGLAVVGAFVLCWREQSMRLAESNLAPRLKALEALDLGASLKRVENKVIEVSNRVGGLSPRR